MQYSLRQAAEAARRTKTTILRAIQKGKLSAAKDAHGEWQIDPAELHRVYEPAPALAPEAGTVQATTSPGQDTAAQREIALLREMLTDRNTTIADLRGERDRWRALLTDQRPKARGWWFGPVLVGVFYCLLIAAISLLSPSLPLSLHLGRQASGNALPSP